MIEEFQVSLLPVLSSLLYTRKTPGQSLGTALIFSLICCRKHSTGVSEFETQLECIGMSISIRKRALIAALCIGAAGCGRNQNHDSQILVSDVEHTAVKRQSVGNCWLYAVGTWSESLHLSATHEQVNLSESYWTYWHFYKQMVNSSATKIQTGGNWAIATNIISAHGYMIEGDFIPGEANLEMSGAQARAEAAVNAAMSEGGELASPGSRTAENVSAVLDRAFGVNMLAAQELAKAASELVTGILPNGDAVKLSDSISARSANGWRAVSYPVIYGENAVPTAAQVLERKKTLLRVMKAVNNYQPVVMSVYIDFNGLDKTDSAFKLETLIESGAPGHQGGHMVVLEDYVVDHVPDGHGGTMSIEEGDVSPELKEKALSGDIRYLKIKNSWGTNRADRGIIDGYHKFYSNYLNVPFEVTNDGDRPGYFSSALNQFILPVGY
jgi:hypothetical protein